MTSEKWDLKDLRKSPSDQMISGVCGGLGEHTPVPSWVWRSAFVFFSCFFGASVLLYLTLFFFMPNGPERPIG